MWKTRKELPEMIKLDLQFDAEQLLKDVTQLERNNDWNACISGELESLRQKWGRGLSNAAYGKDNEQIDTTGKDHESLGYHQMALTEFNDDYTIRSDRKSNTRWDNSFLGGDKKHDERAYNKLKSDIPSYLKSVLESFGPNLTRVGVAKVLPGHEIKPHRDYDPTFSCRFHIALETNPHATFNDTHIPADGHVWFVNTGVVHWVKNEGDSVRTHLIFNMDSQELLDDHFKA